jgi:hypothetical protein
MYHRSVWELLVVASLVVTLFVVAAVPWPSVLVAGVWTTAAGLVFGIATGCWYHIALGRALVAMKALVPRWWLRPVPLHQRLDAAGRRCVLPWFYAGAAGFFVTVVGLALVALSIAVGAWRTS